ncbi:MAG: DUF2461 domain-containing protein [Prevotellaceae bacterium]|jgi:uncharacterized protein (TIGR02453 family)|nr:DUF2461 domain-containing protein [Prevotellaceae bacterium]
MLNYTTLEFLKDLKENNNREWFAVNKQRYEKGRADVEALVSGLFEAINEFDSEIGYPDPKKCLFRIYRDTRFSKDKEPYKVNMGAVLCAEEYKKSWTHADYYVHVEPGKCFLSCGLYMPAPNVLKAVRTAIYEDYDTLYCIMHNPSFVKIFGDFCREDDTLQRAPTGFDRDHPSAEYLKLKHFYVFSYITDKEICSNSFIKQAVKILKAAKPLKDWLNATVEDID